MSNSLVKYISLASFILLASSWSTAQLTTVDLTSTDDSYIDSRFPTTNFGNSTTMQSRTYLYTVGGKGGGATYQYHRRSYVKFDLSSIPSDAVIYSATLTLTRNSGVSGSITWKTKLVTSSWTEGGVTSNNRPTISTLAADIVTTTPNAIGYDDDIDVKDMVQRMVYGQTSNYGWCVQVSNESYWGYSGGTFYTSEYTTADYRPNLEIKYYIPLSPTNVVITHESGTGEQDGGVDLDLSGGASSSYTYSWIEGSTGDVLSSDSLLTDVSYGWYGLHVTGSYGEDMYYAFLVGEDCAEVTIEFETSPEYTDNTLILDLVLGGLDYGDNNYGDHVHFRTEKWTSSGNWYERHSLLKFRLWMDDAFEVTQADMTIDGFSHSTLGGSNASKLIKITEDWNEGLVTWNAAPATSGVITENIASTTSTTQDNTVDLVDFWEAWKANNATNYGLSLQLQNTSNYYHRQVYHSPTATTTSTRPTIDFVLDLRHLDAPYYCNPVYAEVERKLSGIKYKAQVGHVYFFYENEYNSSSTDLNYNIYDWDDQNTPVISGTTSALTLGYGGNQYKLDVGSLTTGEFYLLEVINDKGEKRYLRFEKD